VQRCTACGTHRFYPRALCPSCHADGFAWVPVSGRASVYSFTIVHRAPSPAFAGKLPYALAIVFTPSAAPPPPTGGGGSGGGTPVVDPSPPLPPVTKVETGSPGERIGETYLRAPTSPAACRSSWRRSTPHASG